MKSWKRAALVLLSVFMLGSMTACAGENRVNDATNGSDTRIQRMMTARTEKTPWKTVPTIWAKT